MDRDTQLALGIAVVVLILVGLVVGGCGTMTGMIDDSCDLLNHARTHVK